MNAPSEPESPWSPPSWAGFSISAAFLALAAWFLTGPALTEVPRTRASLVAAESLSTAPRREIVGDPPKIRINNFERLCGELS